MGFFNKIFNYIAKASRPIFKYENKYYLGGPVTLVGGVKHFDFEDLRTSPDKMRESLAEKKIVAGFQTRNPLHGSHVALIENVLKSCLKCIQF